jgi:putative tricarboxylic transport membrane protein
MDVSVSRGDEDMKKRDLVSSVVWMVMGALFTAGALQQGLMRKGVPGPGFLPFISGLALIFISLFVLIPALRRSAQEKGIPFFPEKDSCKKIFLALAALFAFCFALLYAGYIITTLCFMFLMARIMEPRSWKTSALVAFLTSVLTYILFVVLLEVQLPQGPFGF